MNLEIIARLPEQLQKAYYNEAIVRHSIDMSLYDKVDYQTVLENLAVDLLTAYQKAESAVIQHLSTVSPLVVVIPQPEAAL